MNRATKFQAIAMVALIYTIILGGCKKEDTTTIATLTTTAVSNIAQTTAVSGGNISTDGGATVTSRGTCWGTSASPTVSGTKTTDGTGTGPFTSNLTGLVANTKYYTRAYATNSVGTAYGNELSFTTAATVVGVLPTLTTTAVSALTSTTLTSGGAISSEGSASVTARGVCWGTTASPTISNNKTTDGTGSGSFASNITALTASTTYYLRAYGTNSVGTAYGNEVNFTTLASGGAGVARTYTDIAYATASSAQKMDIYVPAGTGPFPVVVLIHGGAFKSGSKSDEAANCALLVANGYVAVSINYRLSGEAKFPAQIQDCKAAIRYLRANAATYSINTEKFASWGASAGGNLASLLGTSGGVAELEGTVGGNATFSSKVIATVDWFGPINFLTMDAEATALGFTLTTNSATSPESTLMGAAIQTIPDQVAKANPTTYITADDAAFFIQVGSLDRNIPYTQSLNFYNALKPIVGDAKVNYELLSGAGHGGTQFSSSTNLAKVMAFLDKYLK